MKNKKVIQGPPISVAFKKVCDLCRNPIKQQVYEHNKNTYCVNCYYKVIGFVKVKPRLIALVWNTGDRMPDKEYYMTDAPKSSIKAAIGMIKQIEDYNTDDFIEFMCEDFYIEKVKAEEYEF